MKQVQIKDFLLVEVPEDSVEFEIYDKESLPLAVMCYVKDPQGYFFPGIPNPVYPTPPGNYTIVGLAKDLSPDEYEEMFGINDIELDYKMNPSITLILKRINP